MEDKNRKAVIEERARAKEKDRRSQAIKRKRVPNSRLEKTVEEVEELNIHEKIEYASTYDE